VNPSLVEVQKLLYFMQEAGEPLRLNFKKSYYGPYADNLRHALVDLEGHYLTGFGDGSARVLDAEPIHVLEGAESAAAEELAASPTSEARIDRVLDLVQGFESMYGLELLASVHWVARYEEPDSASDPDLISKAVRRWTRRKGRLFTERHVAAAWSTLRSRGWQVA
jgi:hypothetical protein